MTAESTMTTSHSIHNDLNLVKESVYDKCGFVISNLKQSIESVEYGACSYEVNGKKIQHRTSKITPTKCGQFVTIWKRNNQGITEPYGISDQLDFIVITSKSGDNIGLFIFPIAILSENGIISSNGKEGKRGIRVYPPWDNPTNKQAKKTQDWQTKFFVSIKAQDPTVLDLTRKLFGI
jgi:hypothetical protein